MALLAALVPLLAATAAQAVKKYGDSENKCLYASNNNLIPSIIRLFPGRLRHASLSIQIVFVALFGSLLGVSLGFGSRWLLLFDGRWRWYGCGLLLGSCCLWMSFVYLCAAYTATYGLC